MFFAQPHAEAGVPREQLQRLVEQVRGGGLFVLTGAGLSTDSGIPGYRGPDGVRRVTPMQYAEFAGSSAARRRYWARSFVGWQRFRAATPNAGHHAVARLQQLGLVDELVTQNVDGLHQRAGSPDVVELHGSLAEVVCLTCGDRSARSQVQERLAAANPGFADEVAQVAPDGSQVSSQIRPDGDIVLADALVEGFHAPLCLVCGADTVKPDVVFFGESVPKHRVSAAMAWCGGADALLVTDAGKPVAVLTRHDLLGFVSA